MTPFLDWYGLDPGIPGYDQSGLQHHCVRRTDGVRLSVQEAEKGGALLEADRQWEGMERRLTGTTMLYDGDRYCL